MTRPACPHETTRIRQHHAALHRCVLPVAAPVHADVSASVGDIVDDLEMGSIRLCRASRDRVCVSVDVVERGLDAAGRGPGGFTSEDLDVDQAALEVDLGYRAEPGGGRRRDRISVKNAAGAARILRARFRPAGRRRPGGCAPEKQGVSR